MVEAGFQIRSDSRKNCLTDLIANKEHNSLEDEKDGKINLEFQIFTKLFFVFIVCLLMSVIEITFEIIFEFDRVKSSILS